MAISFRLTQWESATPPTESLLLQIMTQQQLDPHSWSSRPNDMFSARKHDYKKVIYVVRGNVAFNFPILKKQITLKAGDRLELPASVVYSMQVGAEGVTCLEGRQG